MEETKIYQTENFQNALLKETLKEIVDALEEKGYQAVDQLVGYLMSGDPGYISSHREARKKIQKWDRAFLLEQLVKDYIQK